MSETENSKNVGQIEPESDSPEEDISEPRRKAVSKLVYASPIMASIVFSQKGAAQFSPPDPP
jgi:hypothetical protein